MKNCSIKINEVLILIVKMELIRRKNMRTCLSVRQYECRCPKSLDLHVMKIRKEYPDCLMKRVFQIVKNDVFGMSDAELDAVRKGHSESEKKIKSILSDKIDNYPAVRAVKQSLEKLSNEEVMVKVIHGGVGTINESDVTLASASNAIIIGFNVRPDATAKSIADREKVDMRLYRVIYQAIEDVEAAMKGMLDPIFEEQVIGHAIVRQTFKASGVGTIAGSYVLDGKIQRGCKARVTRDGEQLFDGPLASLKRFKDDVKEVNAGYECGLVFEGFNDLQEDDTIELYMMVEVPR